MFTCKQTPDSHVLFLGVECAAFRDGDFHQGQLMQLALPLSRENEKEHLTTGLFLFSPSLIIGPGKIRVAV